MACPAFWDCSSAGDLPGEASGAAGLSPAGAGRALGKQLCLTASVPAPISRLPWGGCWDYRVVCGCSRRREFRSEGRHPVVPVDAELDRGQSPAPLSGCRARCAHTGSCWEWGVRELVRMAWAWGSRGSGPAQPTRGCEGVRVDGARVLWAGLSARGRLCLGHRVVGASPRGGVSPQGGCGEPRAPGVGLASCLRATESGNF